MALAVSLATLQSQLNTSGFSFSYSHSPGNAICIYSITLNDTEGAANSPTITYGATTLTKAFSADSVIYSAYNYSGFYLSNAPASGTMTVSYGGIVQDSSDIEIVSVSGASITTAPIVKVVGFGIVPQLNTYNYTASFTIPSTSNGLVVGFAGLNTDSSYISSMNGNYKTTPFKYTSLTSSSLTTTFNTVVTVDGSSSNSELFCGAFSFFSSDITVSPYTKYKTGSHMGPWTVGTVLKTTGSSTRNMGAASVVQFIPLADSTAVTCMIPAGSQILNAYTYMTTGVAGTPDLMINGTVVGTISTAAGRNALSVTASAVGTLNNVGTSDVIASYTTTAATGGYLVIHYVVRNKDGSTTPTAYTSTQSV